MMLVYEEYQDYLDGQLWLITFRELRKQGLTQSETLAKMKEMGFRNGK